MSKNLIILAGGMSSRMKRSNEVEDLSKEEIEQANERSKGLIGVGNDGRPLLDYLLYNAKLAGYKNIYLLISENGDLFRECYGKEKRDNNFHELNISFAVQYIPAERIKPFGTSDALLQTLDQYPELIEQDFTVCNSDNLYSVNALSILLKSRADNALINYDRDGLIFPVDRVCRFAVSVVGEKNQLLDIIEKPTSEVIESSRDTNGKIRISMNAFKFKGNMIYSYLKNCPVNQERQEKELPTAILNMVNDYKGSVLALPLCEHVPDLTEKEDIIKVKEFLSSHFKDFSWN